MKNIVLTGVSRGLGLEIARCLLENDYRVYGISRSIPDELENLRKAHPGNLKLFRFDLEHAQGTKDIFDKFIDLETPIHGLVNNAAIAYDDIVTNLRPEPLEKMFRVNVYAPMFLTRHAIRNMLFHRVAGSIVHISSISVHTGYKGLAMYAASKGALEAFSKNTAREWGSRGVRSNCVVAGFMETEMNRELGEKTREKIYRRTALRKETVKESVAAMVEFLLSERSQSVTGQNLFVDSGTI